MKSIRWASTWRSGSRRISKKLSTKHTRNALRVWFYDGVAFSPDLTRSGENEFIHPYAVTPRPTHGTFPAHRGHMYQRLFSLHPRDGGRLGYTMVEMVLVFVLIGLMTGFAVPRISGAIRASQVNRAATLVAGDLEAAWTMAGRYRKPMRITCACGTGRYTIADRNGGTVRLSRALVGDSDLGTMTLTFSEPTTDIFPNGVGFFTTTNAPLVVRVTSGTHTRGVSVTSAGFVRIVP